MNEDIKNLEGTWWPLKWIIEREIEGEWVFCDFWAHGTRDEVAAHWESHAPLRDWRVREPTEEECKAHLEWVRSSTYSIGPQRAAPKSPAAVEAEARQALTIFNTSDSVAAAAANAMEYARARQNLYKEASDQAIAATQDAARYRYIRDVLAQFHSPHMDGTGSYRFRTPPGRGRSLDEVIDALIERDYGNSGRQSS